MIEDIKMPQTYLTVFPDAKDVFADPVERYARLINPFISIDLSAVNPSWSGTIHLVSPVEPVDGLLGELTTDAHNEFLKINWLAFKLNAENKYELLGDFAFFARENTQLKSPHEGFEKEAYLKELDQCYADNQKHFAQAKAKYLKFAALFGDDGGDTFAKKQEYYGEAYNLLDQLGGNASDANWTSYCDGIDMNMDDDENIYPISPSGNRFYFIAGAPGYHYITKGYGEPDWIVLFYEPIERIAWLTFDYS
jgi:hypothetical protein